MEIFYRVRITTGTSPGPYSVQYDTGSSTGYATLYSTSFPLGTPATNIILSDLMVGVYVGVPDNITSLKLINDMDGCSFEQEYLPPTPTPTPTPTISITATPTITPTITITPSSGSVPDVTPTATITPTPTITPTVTSSNSLVVPTCSIFFNNPDGKVYSYNNQTNTSTLLLTGVISSDVAHTESKLWIYSSTLIKEYNITLSPFTYTFNRDINYPTGVASFGAGLGAIDNTTLLTTKIGSPDTVIQLDVSSSTATSTDLFTLPSDRRISGDILKTSSGKYIFTTNKSSAGEDYISQYSSAGVMEFDLLLPSIGAYGIFQDSGNLFVSFYNGDIYQVGLSSPYAITFVQNVGINIYGASQVPTCLTSSFTPTITVTPTRTVTPTISITPTRTVTPTVTPTISVTPSISITPTRTVTPTVTPTISITPSITVTPTVTPTISITPTRTVTPTVTPTISITPTRTVTPTVTPTITVTPSPTLDCLFTITATEEVPTTEECLGDLQFIVQYNMTQGPCPGGHVCNGATFYLRANTTTVGNIYLSNDGSTDIFNYPPGEDVNTYLPSVNYNRYNTLTLTSGQITEIMSLSNTEDISVSLVCSTPPDVNYGFGFGQCHNNVTWIQIYRAGTLIYNGCPSGNFLTINPCTGTYDDGNIGRGS